MILRLFRCLISQMIYIPLGSFPVSLSLCLSSHLRHLISVTFISSRYIFSCSITSS